MKEWGAATRPQPRSAAAFGLRSGHRAGGWVSECGFGDETRPIARSSGGRLTSRALTEARPRIRWKLNHGASVGPPTRRSAFGPYIARFSSSQGTENRVNPRLTTSRSRRGSSTLPLGRGMRCYHTVSCPWLWQSWQPSSAALSGCADVDIAGSSLSSASRVSAWRHVAVRAHACTCQLLTRSPFRSSSSSSPTRSSMG